jgi:hypothetical protein
MTFVTPPASNDLVTAVGVLVVWVCALGAVGMPELSLELHPDAPIATETNAAEQKQHFRRDIFRAFAIGIWVMLRFTIDGLFPPRHSGSAGGVRDDLILERHA